VGPAKAEWHAEALRRADHKIRTALARRPDEGHGEEIHRHDRKGTGPMDAGNERLEIVDDPVRRRILDKGGKERLVGHFMHRADNHADPEGFGARPKDGDRLRVAVVGDIDGIAVPDAARHGHGLGGGCCLVEQRGIREVHGREIGDHGLEIEHGFEAPLRDFRLVGRVGGVPAGIFEDVAADDRRGEAGGISHADVGGERGVVGDNSGQIFEGRFLRAGGGKVQRTVHPQTVRDTGLEKFLHRGKPESREHFARFRVRGSDMAFGEGGGAHRAMCAR